MLMSVHIKLLVQYMFPCFVASQLWKGLGHAARGDYQSSLDKYCPNASCECRVERQP